MSLRVANLGWEGSSDYSRCYQGYFATHFGLAFDAAGAMSTEAADEEAAVAASALLVAPATAGAAALAPAPLLEVGFGFGLSAWPTDGTGTGKSAWVLQ